MSDSVEPDPVQLIQLSRTQPAAFGTLLELYREYLTLLTRLQIGPELQGKMDPSDVVQDAVAFGHWLSAQEGVTYRSAELVRL